MDSLDGWHGMTQLRPWDLRNSINKRRLPLLMPPTKQSVCVYLRLPSSRPYLPVNIENNLNLHHPSKYQGRSFGNYKTKILYTPTRTQS
jgi:hypothetical protein